MSIELRWLPRGEAGTRETLHAMLQLAREGAAYRPLRQLGRIPALSLDSWLRHYWTFVPDGEHEAVRSIPRMLEDFSKGNRFQGDCDDAATLAAAMLLANRPHRASFVAVRPPHDMAFVHVFVAVEESGYLRIDPTAPLDADYSTFEPMVLHIF